MNSLALSGLDYRKPWYFGGGRGGRGKRHNYPLQPLEHHPPGAGGGSSSGGGGGGGGGGGQGVAEAGGVGPVFDKDDEKENERDFDRERDKDREGESEKDVPGAEPGDHMGDRCRAPRPGGGAVSALFAGGPGPQQGTGHLPPWLLPGYGSDGAHWPAGTPTDTHIQARNWKKPSDKYENVGTQAMELATAESLDQPHDCDKAGCQRVIINVSGQRYETQLRTLNRFPETLLGDPIKRKAFWDSRRNEFFIDRHRPSFQAILYYYQSGGRLRRPIEVPEDIFLDELEFYEIGEERIKEYKIKEGFLMDEVKPVPKNKVFKLIWLTVEEPDTSKFARVFAIVSVTCILISIINFCLETLPRFTRKHCVNVTSDGGETFHEVPNYGDVFFIIETVCVAWFTIEFILRAISCPHKFAFVKNIMNIFDVMAILPYFITLITIAVGANCDSAKSSGSFIFIRVLRVFRIFKLSKHSQGLRILGLTIKSSMRELGMFFFFLIVAMVIFSSAAYYAEAGEPDSQLKSIPGAFWWAIVTMTTVGYGDVTPVGLWGKLVGTLCVIAGVLTIALPVPVVVANFNNFYRHEGGGGGVGG